jgi:hypothetical protein
VDDRATMRADIAFLDQGIQALQKVFFSSGEVPTPAAINHSATGGPGLFAQPSPRASAGDTEPPTNAAGTTPR